MLVKIEEKVRIYKSILIDNEVCELCNKNESINLNLMQNYNETFGIIRFPIEKFGLLECNESHKNIPEINWSNSLKKRVQNELENKDAINSNFIWSWLWKVTLIIVFGYLICWKLAIMIVDSY